MAALESGGEFLPETLGAVMPTDQLLADANWETWVREVMHEILAVAQAKQLEIDPDLPGKMIENTRAMGEYYASTLLDHRQGRPLEHEPLFAEPLRQAQASGVNCPRLEALVTVLGKISEKSEIDANP